MMKFILIIILNLLSVQSLWANDFDTANEKIDIILKDLENEFAIFLPSLVNPYYVAKPEIKFDFLSIEDTQGKLSKLKLTVFFVFKDENLRQLEKQLFSTDILKLYNNSFKDKDIISSQIYARILFGRKGVYDFLASHPKFLSKEFKEFLPAPYLEKIGLSTETIVERIKAFKNSKDLYSQENFQKSLITIGEYFYLVVKNHINEQLSNEHQPDYRFSLAAAEPMKQKKIRTVEEYYAIPFSDPFTYWIESNSPKDFYLSMEFLLPLEQKLKIEKSGDPITAIVELYINQFNKLVTEDLEALKNFGILAVLKRNQSKSSPCGQSFENQ